MRRLLRVVRPTCMVCTMRSVGTMTIEEPVLKRADTVGPQNETAWNIADAKPGSDAASSASANSGSNAGAAPGDGLGSCFHCGKAGHWVRDCPSLPLIPDKTCPCGGGVCKILVAKTPQNAGRQFYKCPLGKDEGSCGFFEWCDGKGFPYYECHCGAGPCVTRTAKTAKNPGRPFYTCPRPVEESCGFFKWCDEIRRPPLSISAREGYFNLFQSNNVKSEALQTCYKCGEVGHWATDCPVAVQNSTPEGKAISFQSSKVEYGACHKCGEVGHWARDCSNQQVSTGWTESHEREIKVLRRCFKCGEVGHWAKACPKYSKGVYIRQ